MALTFREMFADGGPDATLVEGEEAEEVLEGVLTRFTSASQRICLFGCKVLTVAA